MSIRRIFFSGLGAMLALVMVVGGAYAAPKVSQMVQQGGFEGHPAAAFTAFDQQEDGPGNCGPHGGQRREIAIGVVADTLGMEPEDVVAALRDGQTIADLAGDQTDAVIDALVAEAQTHIDQAVADGKMDAERAEELSAGLEERITDMVVNGVRPEGGPGGPGGPDRRQLEAAIGVVADTLGMEVEDVVAALRDGQTIADLAGDQTDAVIDALVAEAQTHIDQAVADGKMDAERAEELSDGLEERITEMVVNGVRPEGGPGGPGGHGGPGRRQLEVAIGVVADTLGMEVEDVVAALRDGQTIADLAGDQTDAVIDALVAEAQTHIDQAVADGKMDAERAEELSAGLEERITDMVNGVRPEGGPGGPGPDGGPSTDGSSNRGPSTSGAGNGSDL